MTEIIFTFSCGKHKSGCEALMKQIIEDIEAEMKALEKEIADLLEEI
ncbi:MAG: hypothetical protein U1C33_05265 [Candidatus Cloacimonadaceae bacterium]|nr:hypothetical protein [Candidatus Cloacimonadaceae bacterium]